MKHLNLSWLILKNHILSLGWFNFLSKIFLHDFIVLLTLLCLFQGSSALTWATVTLTYPFFVSLFGLSAGLSIWEASIQHDVTRQLLLSRFRSGVASHILPAFVCTSPILFFFLLCVARDPRQGVLDLLLIVTLALAFILLGVALGFCWGWNREKSLNNWLYLTAWILAFSPNFSPTKELTWLSYVFPMHPSQSSYELEFLKTMAFASSAGLLFSWGRQPRRHIHNN